MANSAAMSLLLVLLVAVAAQAVAHATPRITQGSPSLEGRVDRVDDVTDFPYSCFIISPYPDITTLTYYSTVANGDVIYTGTTTLNGQSYAVAYAHVQNATGAVHIVLSYTGRATNMTRAILIQPGGSGGDTISTTYMVNNFVLGFYEAPHDVTLLPCNSMKTTMEYSGTGSAEVPKRIALERVGGRPISQGKYCIDLYPYTLDYIYLNITSTDSYGTTALQGDTVYTGNWDGNTYGLLTASGALFLVAPYAPTQNGRVMSSITPDPNGFDNFGSTMSYGFDFGVPNYFYDAPSSSYSFQSCTTNGM